MKAEIMSMVKDFGEGYFRVMLRMALRMVLRMVVDGGNDQIRF